MDFQEELFRFLLAVAMGLLVGFQRETSQNSTGGDQLVGIRTFAILGMLGYGAVFLSQKLDSALPMFGILLAICGLAVTAFFMEQQGKKRHGPTTQAAMFMTVVIGAICGLGEYHFAVAVGVTTTALLSFKEELHGLAHRVTRMEMVASLKFALMCAVVLPVLPNRPLSPFPLDVINPFELGLLVLLISGIGFVGFFLLRWVEQEKGMGIMGFLGGIASSTALTLSFSQKSRLSPAQGNALAFALLIAWTVMYLRLLALLAIMNFELAMATAPAMLFTVLFGAVVAFVAMFRARGSKSSTTDATLTNPFEIFPALKFALLLTVVMIISRVAQVSFGGTGLMISSLISGIANTDAVALSMVELLKHSSDVSVNDAARACVIAGFSNTISKGVMVAALAGGTLIRALFPGFLVLSAAAGVSLLLFF